jgi:hypothetical protein
MKPFLALIAMTTLVWGAAAQACEPTTSEAVAVGDHYVYNPCLDSGPGGIACQWWPWMIWIYEESNGMPGLQRGDETWDDTCGGLVEGDTIVF